MYTRSVHHTSHSRSQLRILHAIDERSSSQPQYRPHNNNVLPRIACRHCCTHCLNMDSPSTRVMSVVSTLDTFAADGPRWMCCTNLSMELSLPCASPITYHRHIRINNNWRHRRHWKSVGSRCHHWNSSRSPSGSGLRLCWWSMPCHAAESSPVISTVSFHHQALRTIDGTPGKGHIADRW
jgi:hypothetical protein